MPDFASWPLPIASAVALAFGYLMGAIPFGVILTRFARTADIRTVGSGNIGATNVLRTGRKGLAAATLLGDMLKGTAAVLIVMACGGPRLLALLAAFGAFIGHLYPVWIGFKGGKGVATYIGLLLPLYWPAALAFCGIWLAAAAISRYSSLSALVASALTPGILLLAGLPQEALLFLVLSAILWLRHHENIARLLSGAESRISLSGGGTSPD